MQQAPTRQRRRLPCSSRLADTRQHQTERSAQASRRPQQADRAHHEQAWASDRSAGAPRLGPAYQACRRRESPMPDNAPPCHVYPRSGTNEASGAISGQDPGGPSTVDQSKSSRPAGTAASVLSYDSQRCCGGNGQLCAPTVASCSTRGARSAPPGSSGLQLPAPSSGASPGSASSNGAAGHQSIRALRLVHSMYKFASDGFELESDSALRFRNCTDVAETLAANGLVTLDVRDVPDCLRPGTCSSRVEPIGPREPPTSRFLSR